MGCWHKSSITSSLVRLLPILADSRAHIKAVKPSLSCFERTAPRSINNFTKDLWLLIHACIKAVCPCESWRFKHTGLKSIKTSATAFEEDCAQHISPEVLSEERAVALTVSAVTISLTTSAWFAWQAYIRGDWPSSSSV
eukprot:Lithocolla_globosa_v1_NODE_5626_length_1208_cov_7.118820.p2 type:complete len:139 gc:universal NODE_5626_length_1208_cov_7.118820:730-314(-)